MMLDLCSLMSQELSFCMWQKEACSFVTTMDLQSFPGNLSSDGMGMTITGQTQIPAMCAPSLAEPHDSNS